jgi:hypothetical protein
MSRVVVVVACSFAVAACSVSLPSLDFLKSSPPTAALRFESEPPGAEVTASGQTCHTPCELTVQVAELSATFALKGYQPHTIPVRSQTSGPLSSPRFEPNPVHAVLQPVRPATPSKKRIKKKPPLAASHEDAPAPAAPAANAPAAPTTAPSPPSPDDKK